MFFATPHLDFSPEKWKSFTTHVLRCNAPFKGVKPSKKMLAPIELNSYALYDITEDFKPLQRELEFVNLLETDSMDGLDKCVSLNRSLYVVFFYVCTPTRLNITESPGLN